MKPIHLILDEDTAKNLMNCIWQLSENISAGRPIDPFTTEECTRLGHIYHMLDQHLHQGEGLFARVKKAISKSKI